MALDLIIGGMALFFLGVFSYQDIKYKKIENEPIIAFLIIGLMFACKNGNLLPTSLFAIFLGVLGWGMWKRKIWGGADAKILPCLAFFLPTNIALYALFFAIFGTLGGIYGIIMRRLKGDKAEVAFIPIIFLSYLVLLIFS